MSASAPELFVSVGLRAAVIGVDPVAAAGRPVSRPSHRHLGWERSEEK
jgi:hypothetical protein